MESPKLEITQSMESRMLEITQSTDSRKLEITLHRAKGLRNVKNLRAMNPYAVITIAGYSDEFERRTDVHKKGATDPVWNCPMKFDLVSMKNDDILFCEIKHNGTLGDRKIGEVLVPFEVLLAGDASGKEISYPVATPSGEEQGEIILSHKFSELVVRSGNEDGTGTSSGEVANALMRSGNEDGNGICFVEVADAFVRSGNEDGTGTSSGEVADANGNKKDGMAKRFAKKVAIKMGGEIVMSAATSALSKASQIADDII